MHWVVLALVASIQASGDGPSLRCPVVSQPEEIARKGLIELALPAAQAEAWIAREAQGPIGEGALVDLIASAPRESSGEPCAVYQFRTVGFRADEQLLEVARFEGDALTNQAGVELQVVADTGDRDALQAAARELGFSIAAARSEPGQLTAFGAFENNTRENALQLARQTGAGVLLSSHVASEFGVRSAPQPVRFVDAYAAHLETSNLIRSAAGAISVAAGRGESDAERLTFVRGLGEWRIVDEDDRAWERRFELAPVAPAQPYEQLGVSFRDETACFIETWFPDNNDDQVLRDVELFGLESANSQVDPINQVRATVSRLRGELGHANREVWESLVLALTLTRTKADTVIVEAQIEVGWQHGSHWGPDLFLLQPFAAMVNRQAPDTYQSFPEASHRRLAVYAQSLLQCFNGFILKGVFEGICPRGFGDRADQREALQALQFNPAQCAVTNRL